MRKFIWIYLFFVMFTGLFRNLMALSLGHLVLLAVACIFIILYEVKVRLPKAILLYASVMTVSLIINLFFSPNPTPVILFSFVQYSLLVVLSFLLVQSSRFSYLDYVRSLLWFGIPLILGGYIHKFISYSIFGLIYNKIWTELDFYSSVSYRMISFILSPQSFSAVTFIVAIVAIELYFYRKNFLSILYLFLYIPTIFIAGTRYPLIVLFIFAIILLSKNYRYLKVFRYVVFGCVFLFSFVLIGGETFSRISFDSLILSNPIFISWSYYLSMVTAENYLFATNMGSIDTWSSELSPESFIIRTIYEIGFIPLLAVLNYFFKIISFKDSYSIAYGTALLTSVLFTPAFSGSIVPAIVLPIVYCRRYGISN